MEEKQRATKKKKIRSGIHVTHMVHSSIMYGFDEIEDYNEFMKSAIKHEQEKTSQRMEKETRLLDINDREQYYDIYGEDYQKIGEVFEKLALDSFVVTLYARIEAGMCDLCDALRQDRQRLQSEKIDLRYSDLRANGYLDQAILYMKKVLGVDLDLGNNAQWPEIVGLRIIRNAIVHEEGRISTRDGALKKHVKRGFIELRHRKEEKDGQITGLVRIKSEYVDSILPKVRQFFQGMKI